MEQEGLNLYRIRGSFMMKPAADGKSLELIENFEMTDNFRDFVTIPYFKQKFKVVCFLFIGSFKLFRKSKERNK